jgi:ureidoglycolate hydrolase
MAERTLPVDDLTDEAFAPFGTVVRTPSRPHDAAGPGWRWWAETVELQDDGRRWCLGYLDLEPSPPPRFDWAERHLRSQ